MDTTNRLVALRMAMDYALEAMDEAVEHAQRAFGDTLDHEYDAEGYIISHGEGWKEMGALADRLRLARDVWREAMPPEIVKACDGAQEDLDHWSDLADAASY